MSSVLLTILLLVLVASGVGLRVMEARQLARRWEHYRLVFPSRLAHPQVMAALAALSGAPIRPLVFEVIGSSSGIEHRLRVQPEQSGWVTRQLRATIPGLRVERIDAAPLALSCGRELRLTKPALPLRTDSAETAAAALLAAFQPLAEGQALVLQLVLGPLVPLAPPPAADSLRLRLGGHAVVRLRGSKEVEQARRAKAGLPLFGVTARLGAAAANRAAGGRLLARPWSVLASLRTPHTRLAVRLLPDRLVAWRLAHALPAFGHAPSTVNTAELAVLVGWPIGAPQVAGLSLGTARLLAPAPGVPTTGRVVGIASASDEARRVAIRPDDALRHTYIVGPTGAGKSTLLLNLITADLAAGHGVVVIDPKGDLVSEVLDRVPARRVKDVILLDPTDAARPVGLNVLAGAEDDAELVTDQVVGIFARLYASSWGPRTEDVLRASLLTLTQVPGLTLCELPRLLHDAAFRRELVARLDDPLALEPFWAWYESLRDGERAQIIAPLMNKLRAVLLRSSIRSIVGQTRSSFDLGAVLAERRVLLVSLPKGELGEDAARLLGSLVFARLWQAVQGRSALPPADRAAVFAYLDEFQDFLGLPTALADVLAQARGLGFGLTLAHQHTYQLPTDVREAVLANTRTKIIFQTSATDAGRLSRELAPDVSAEDLQHLGAHEVYLAPCVDGQTLPPLSAVTLPPPPIVGYAQAVRQRSRQWYGRSRTAIERELRNRQIPTPALDTLGRRQRAS